MSTRKVTAALVILAALGLAVFAAVSGDMSAPPRKTVYSKQLPPGDGQELVSSTCQTCHSAMLITQQHKDSTGWEKSVTQMEKWGARLVPSDHAIVVGYLLKSFGPVKKAAAP
jgi:cytochrome c5